MASSPARGSQSHHAKGPLSSRSINIASPSKTVYLENKEDDNGSPWRIKVTVQAEPASPNVNRSIKSSRTAHRETQSSSPVKRVTRRSRKTASSPAKESPQKSMPARQRNDSIQTHDLIEIPDGDSNDYSLSEIEAARPPTDDEGRDVDASATSHMDDYRSQGRFESYASKHSITVSSVRAEGQNASPGGLVTEAQSNEHPPPHSRATTSPGFPTEQDWSENEDEPVLGAEEPGDATMLESEEFSMISVDSLSSHPRLTTHLSPETFSDPSRKQPAGTAADFSYMPSSPPTYLPRYRETPVPSDSPPKYPAAPGPTSAFHNSVGTPLQESARKSGRALQDVLSGPFRESSSRASASERDTVFAGFSAGTRRQLRESLYAGQTLATPQLGGQPNFGLGVQGAPRFAQPLPVPSFSSPFHSPIRRDGNADTHRLPTPEEMEEQARAESSTPSADKVQDPSLAGTLQHPVLPKPVLASPYLEYDAMSWVATGPSASKPKGRSSLGNEVVTQTEDSQSPESSRHTTPQSGASSVRDGTSHRHDGTQEVEVERLAALPEESEASKDIWQEEAEDIWQEEASRSHDDEDTPPILREDLPIKPRRAKLPGTWRRTSEAHFNYSDSPEPEEISNRKVSATTSASGIMTPPATEDERVDQEKSAETRAMEQDEDDESDEADGNRNSVIVQRVLSPAQRSIRSCKSTDSDDTGVFWLNNLPTLFDRPNQRPTRRSRAGVSTSSIDEALQGDQSFAAGSPLRNTILDISPMKPPIGVVNVGKIRSETRDQEQTDAIRMPTPLRLSLLKSSKVRGSIGKSSSSEAQLQSDVSVVLDTDKTLRADERHDESFSSATSSSMASDARQLHRELTQQLDLSTTNKAIDLTHTPSESSASQSYIEELNRDSPVRIRVNFNDSIAGAEQESFGHNHDQNGRSALISPKKQYPPLFDNAPSLQPSTEGGKAKTSSRPLRQNGFVSRLTESFWEAVTAPSPNANVKPTIVISPSPSPAPTANQHAKQSELAKLANPAQSRTNDNTPTSVPDHVLRLRRKYGLLPQTHPFTYAHIRTLHRMLNSVRSSAPSIIPTSGSLRPELEAMKGKTVTNDLDQSFTWTEKYLHLVDSYLSLLLPASERKRLVEHTGAEWGDEAAKSHRGFDSKGRHGSQKVFSGDEKGKVEISWVIGIVEGILFKEEMNERKKKVQAMMANLSVSEG